MVMQSTFRTRCMMSKDAKNAVIKLTCVILECNYIMFVRVSLGTARREETYAVSVRYANQLGPAALGKHRDSGAQQRLWDPRKCRRHRWI